MWSKNVPTIDLQIRWIYGLFASNVIQMGKTMSDELFSVVQIPVLQMPLCQLLFSLLSITMSLNWKIKYIKNLCRIQN